MPTKTARSTGANRRRNVWEYDVKEFFGPWTSESLEVGEAVLATKQFLNRRGREGWEITAVLVRPGDIPDTYVIFKRCSR